MTDVFSVAHTTQAHDATVSKLSWAHPEFGSILASSSFDRTVKIWEQTYSEPESQANGAKSQNASRWIERAVLVDAKGTVRSVEFAPRHFGLKLVGATNSAPQRGSSNLFPTRPQSLLIIICASTNALSNPSSRHGNSQRRSIYYPSRPPRDHPPIQPRSRLPPRHLPLWRTRQHSRVTHCRRNNR